MNSGYQVMATSPASAWLRRLAPVADPWVRLVCFPHAGGTAAFFRSWRSYLRPDVELYAVQYPGRLDRMIDPCVEDMDQMADSVLAALRPLTDRPLALFGHSLGAAIAFEVARRPSGRGWPGPARLFVSGRPSPDQQRPDVMHLASDDVLWQELSRLGGTRTEILEDPELRRAFLPALRSDYRLSELYQARPGPPLACPVTALLGDRDSEVDLAEAQGWSAYTRAGFTLRTFPGEHFYLTSRAPDVIDEIVLGLAESVPPRNAGP